MRFLLRGKRGGLILFLAITALVIGGLGWVTRDALRLEAQQNESQAEADLQNKLRLALWRLDTLVFPDLDREAARPFSQYRVRRASQLSSGGSGRLPLTALELELLPKNDAPVWLDQHFLVSVGPDWRSLVNALGIRVTAQTSGDEAYTTDQEQFLFACSRELNLPAVLTLAPEKLRELADSKNAASPNNVLQFPQDFPVGNTSQGASPTPQGVRQGKGDADTAARAQAVQKGQVNYGFANSQALMPSAGSKDGQVIPQPTIRRWIENGQEERLVLARLIDVGQKQISQITLLDWHKLQGVLAEQIREDLFPQPRFQPVRLEVPECPERVMAALPIEINPGILRHAALDGWTPLRVGLLLAWLAALIALAAVGLGGWSLLDLAERRIRFVSAVTHELRTPLTTLRLYLDMLTGGVVKEEKQKDEYLQTLHTETDRLNRLVGNVLDFSRLENQRPRLDLSEVRVADFLDQIRSTWEDRCRNAGKELLVENAVGDTVTIRTDVKLLQQIICNLIDNACKYSREASDPRIWLRAVKAEASPPTHLVLEVQDCGPGVSAPERRAIFRPFRRGKRTEVTGGVGLGLALAHRWARLLGGRLALETNSESAGACFRLELRQSVNQ